MSEEIKKYGKTEEDVKYQKMHTCRDIVKEILNFGVNEEQKKQIIKLLALELEDNVLMRDICSLVKGNKESSDTKLIYSD